MKSDQWRAVTVNLGCGGPRAGQYRDEVFRWAQEASGHYDVVFVQEMPHDAKWRDLWEHFTIVEREKPKYRPRSAVIIRDTIAVTKQPLVYRTSDYHDSYVAGAVVERRSLGAVVLMSVHASPQPVSNTWREDWTNCDGPDLPGPRSCGLWDSDLVLTTAQDVAQQHKNLIVAGDWNEARAWDDDDRHTLQGGREFFANVERFGFVDRCCPKDDEGAPTHGTLHLDHVFTTPAVQAGVDVSTEPIPKEKWPADHRPVEFTIG